MDKMDHVEIILKPRKLYGTRHTQYLLMFFAMIISYGMRTVLNNAIVEMVKPHHNQSYPTYPEWKDKKNIVLSSFFWGYICLQVGAGQLAKKYGPKMFLLIATILTAVFTAFTPLAAAQFGYGGVIFCRVCMGLCQGFLVPSIHTLLSLWAPLTERARYGGFVYAGQVLANAVALIVTGFISSTPVGWPVAFYVYATIGLWWCILWFWLGSDSPAKHKTISLEERKWIESELVEQEEKKAPTPWKSIATSLPFISILLTHFTQNWGFWTLMTEIPSYMDKILEMDVTKNSVLSSLPYFCCWLFTLLMSPIADILIEREMISLIASRKIFNSIGFLIPAIALFCLTFGSTQPTISVIILVIAVGFNAGQYCGFNVNHIDIAPTHAGTLMAITNSAATVASILAPLAVDWAKDVTGYEETDVQLWNIIFYIASLLYLFGGIVFILYGSGEIQPWDNPKKEVSNAQIIRKASEMRSSASIFKE